MSTIKNEIRKNTLMQILAGFVLWFFVASKDKKNPVLNIGNLEPLGPDYISEFFKDSEYFGLNVIPVAYYSNWLRLVKELDKIRRGFGAPILIKKGFNIQEEGFISCEAVEIYPQNNNYTRLYEVVNFMESELMLSVIQKKENNNLYLKL